MSFFPKGGLPIPVPTPQVNVQRLWSALEELARIGATPGGGVTRLALSDEDVAARRLLLGWMQEAGLDVRVGDAGNLYGRRAGQRPDLPPVAIGSHHGSVVQDGRFDDAFGVLAALQAVRTLRDLGISIQHPIEVVSWTGEESSRFDPALLGSWLGTGVFTQEYAYSRTDRRGRRFGEELQRTGFRGSPQNRLKSIWAYIESHIEQGSVLEAEGIQIGLVESIVGMVRLKGRVLGEPYHAGPTPMTMRRDAGLAAARLALAVRDIAWALDPDAVGTVGQMEFRPAQVNVIPGEAHFSVDFRHPDESAVSRAVEMLHHWGQRIARKKGVPVELEEIWRVDGVRFDPEVVGIVEAVARQLGYSCRRVPSYAGHDAKYVARLGPTGMIFIPCKAGKSHAELEETTPEDVPRGANVLLGAVLQLAA